MQNPWPTNDTWEPPFILESDRVPIDRLNANCHRDVRVIVESFPQPFIGDPDRARIVFLALNPGHSEKDPVDHAGNDEFLQAMRLNLRHSIKDYPFYPLDPRFLGTGAGQWWSKRTKELIQAGIPNEVLAEKLMVIEWFPYHSMRFARQKDYLASQLYSFHLAKQMLESKLIVCMRSRKAWSEVDARFNNVPYLKNPRCGHVSRRNTSGSVFDEIVAALKKD